MIPKLFLFLLLLLFFKQSDQKCDLNSQESHLSCQEIEVLLDYHNEVREMVNSGKTKLKEGKNMWVLKWDPELADVAQAYANKCIYAHNKHRPKGSGENLAWSGSSTDTKSKAKYLATLWYKEIKDYEYDGEFVLHATGHFTQMVWADTKYVGCGLSYYDDGTKPKTPHQTLLVCDYRPAGNVQGHKPYELLEGERCDRGVLSKKFPTLCAHDKKHAEGDYVIPCSGTKIQPSMLFFIVCLLCRLRSLSF